jgi:hypothetical protein
MACDPGDDAVIERSPAAMIATPISDKGKLEQHRVLEHGLFLRGRPVLRR